MKWLQGIGWFLSVLMIFSQSCKDIHSYPDTPEVKFKEFRYSDTTLVFSFTDGDGDFGIPEGDLDPPYDTASEYYYNVFYTFEEKVDTGYIRVPMADYTAWNLRVEGVPQPEGQNKTMIGKIELRLFPILGSNYVYPDTFRFTFSIVDYALNKSNVGVSPSLSFPK